MPSSEIFADMSLCLAVLSSDPSVNEQQNGLFHYVYDLHHGFLSKLQYWNTEHAGFENLKDFAVHGYFKARYFLWKIASALLLFMNANIASKFCILETNLLLLTWYLLYYIISWTIFVKNFMMIFNSLLFMSTVNKYYLSTLQIRKLGT